MSSIDLSVNIKNLVFKNPVCVASGTFGYGEEFSEIFDINKLGAIITKTITLNPKIGNPPQRVVETASGLINSIGLENPGVDKFISEKMKYLKTLNVPVIVSIAGSSKDEYVQVAGKINVLKNISAIEVNVSCPNVKEGGIEFGKDPQQVMDLTKKIREVTDKVIIIKLSPNVSDITSVAKAAVDGGCDAISLVNTFLAMAVDVRTRKPVLGNIFGGLSGPCIKPIALRMVRQVYEAVNVPIIGMGGITNYKDAVEFILCGASVVCVGTANFVEPMGCLDIIKGIEKYLGDCKISSLKDLIGKLEKK